MKRTFSNLIMAAAVTVTVALPATTHADGYVAHGALVSGPAAVRVWVEGGDVFPDFNHVTLWVRPERDCYTSLFLVDTAGFLHVLNADEAWLYGGRTYGFPAHDLGLDRLDGRGIAYVFAVGSPVPFDYSRYGASVRVGGFGFRVAGDPFVGCREFYMSLLPATCRWDYVGVSYTRFYVREWVRYPSYLCGGGHVRVGDWCHRCEPVYAAYRCNVAAPYEVIRPHVRYKDARYATDVRHVVRTVEPRQRDRYQTTMRENVRVKTRENVRVVSTSREISRNPHLAKSRVSAPVHESANGNESQMVAYKGHGQKQNNAAQVARGKGAHKKVRQAE